MIDGKQSIAQIRADDGTLWYFLQQLPSSSEAQIFYALLIGGFAGMTANWFWKWARKEIDGNLFCYLVIDNPRATLVSLMAYLGLALTALYTDAFHVGDEHVFVGWSMVLWLSATNGFFIDAIANKGKTAVWTNAEREAKRESS